MVFPERYSLTTDAVNPERGPPTPHPKFLKFMRVVFTLLVCLMGLATSIMSIVAVQYFNDHRGKMILPSWGSLIFLVFLGFFTCFMYFGYYLFLPHMWFIRPGSFLSGLFMMKIEVMYLFAMSAIWISGALAYACDFRGHDTCLFDGYYHDPKPQDWGHLCDIINWVVPLAYTTFGVQAAFLGFECIMLSYMFLFIDQDSINEPFYSWGQRAYDFRHPPQAALASSNQPMLYRPKGRPAAERGNFMDNKRGGDAYQTYNEKRYYDEDGFSTLRHSSASGSGSSQFDEKSMVSHAQSSRGRDYSDPSSASASTFDSGTIASQSNYYGGAYSRASANGRRAGLTEAPVPAGAGGTGTMRAPTWSAPSITTDGDSVRDNGSWSPSLRNAASMRQGRRVSAPVSLGARGRRGTAYVQSDNGTDLSDEYTSAIVPDLKRTNSAKARNPASGRLANAMRDQFDGDEESGWHLREE
ncbi:hypothetical protein MVES1_001372 [Malassezia vespertilionis]|uniref:MARVEL domain-containing protein n=1 Tax=Malassezia vespertilionis TaxID=2020962 RepID=A0A2N1JEA4_9BASI|nr:uncharacterized protein MVES1_001372 [Malassezia vespertilionis]PKI84878.1 hypothetical protein MVES_001289 [Malassezia vespertilionis]WFD06034.1 hypothetical protein MVES1_001372 [Malassezia vespertilionis]